MRKTLKAGALAILVGAAGWLAVPLAAVANTVAPCDETRNDAIPDSAACRPVEQVTIFGRAVTARDVAGGANQVTERELEIFAPTDVVRAIRRVPGVSLQVEDGYGLRPNISIRGTATERSSRVTLLEDNVLIAPAPYSAPSAYYFPTFGRISSIEVLKGPASVSQGPYTVGGAVNLRSTPVPEQRAGSLRGELGSDSTWRVHGHYGDSGERAGFLVETHQWHSDGFQHIDRSTLDTGLDKQDYLARFRYSPVAGERVDHHFSLKLQDSSETSRQSYLGLTDRDFARDALRRYGTSALDEMDNAHEQLTATWRMAFAGGAALAVTAYYNRFERAWYKTEGLDFDGSDDAQSFQRTSWSNVVDAINRGQGLGGLAADDLQAILDGADTAPGSIQLRNNAREYYSRGVQALFSHALDGARLSHEFELGLRLHQDQEDRLQRNDSYRQLDGRLQLSDRGLEGNAGNRVQEADAWAVFAQDRIRWDRWTFTPGLRFESIDLRRVDYDTSSPAPGSRAPDNLKGIRSNEVDVWIPGLGLMYDIDDRLRLVGGVHRGFSTPGNQPGVKPERSTNYELGLRYGNDDLQLELMGFFNDYENLVGVCTNSSGSGCEPGDAFNGDGVRIPGLEFSLLASLGEAGGWTFPLQAAYTWMDAEFETGFDSEFFGEVHRGDPVPYIPAHQAWASLGAERDALSLHLSLSHVDAVCTQARCDAFERTGSATLLDLAAHYRIRPGWELYAVVENLGDENYVAGRQPYGVRPNKPRSWSLGTRYEF